MKYITILLSLILLTILVSCNKDETVTPGNNTTVTTQPQSNLLRGYVDCWDYTDSTNIEGYNPYKLKPQFKVEVIGNNNQIINQTYSDSIGFFKFDSLQAGTWDFRFSRPGWNTAILKSIHHGPGPKPTIVGMEQILGRSIYSEIIDFRLDSVNNISNHYFTLTINPNPLDSDMDKIRIKIDGFSYSFYSDNYTFIPPNKYIIRVPLFWNSGETKTFNSSFWTSYACSYTNYGLWSDLYQFQGLPEVKAFTITKP
jgi:hypothetical protein